MAGTMLVRGVPYKRHRLPEEEAEVAEEITSRLKKHKEESRSWQLWSPESSTQGMPKLRLRLPPLRLLRLWLPPLPIQLPKVFRWDLLRELFIFGKDLSELFKPMGNHRIGNLREIFETEFSYMQDSSDVDNNNLPLLSSTQERQGTEIFETEFSYMQDSTDVDNNNLPLLSSTQERQRTENTSSEWIFIVISLVLEGLSLAFDQIASPRKPYYGLIGMLLAIVALLVTTWELVRKTRKEIVKSRRRGMLRRFHYPHSHSSVYGTLPDIYGIFGGITQFVCSTVQYAYLRRHAESPIQASLLPAIFLLCLGTVKLTESRNGTSGDARPQICQICRHTTGMV